jgi:low molecular weight protein-tyrosine phosphatase
MTEVGSPRVGGLLVVCTANVCRSPLAQREFQRAFAGVRALEGCAVGSAGVRAETGRPMCSVSAAALPDDESDRDFITAHRSHLLTEQDVRSADLVLVMERDHRSAVVRLAPGSQAKVFTLREAEGLLGVLAERGSEPAADLAGLARALHSVRGFAPLPPEPPKRRWFQRPVEPEDPFTIVDGHGLEDDLHASAVATVASTARRVAAALIARMAQAT